MKTLSLLLCLGLATPAGLRAQDPEIEARRGQLQAQIVQRFMDHVATELSLDAATRTRLQQHLRESGEQRRQLAHKSAQLRGQMMRVTRDTATADDEFKRLLSEMTALREQEESLWRKDQDALSRILTPRQHVRFVFMWLRFNDQIRDIAHPRGALPPPGRPRRP